MRVMFSEEEVLEVSSAKLWVDRNENKALVDLTISFNTEGQKDELYYDFDPSSLSEGSYDRAKAIIRELTEKGFVDLSKDPIKKMTH